MSAMGFWFYEAGRREWDGDPDSHSRRCASDRFEALSPIARGNFYRAKTALDFSQTISTLKVGSDQNPRLSLPRDTIAA
jgi:hypothetical protein